MQGEALHVHLSTGPSPLLTKIMTCQALSLMHSLPSVVCVGGVLSLGFVVKTGAHYDNSQCLLMVNI